MRARRGKPTRQQVVSVYREILGRAPAEEEISQRLATLGSLDELLRLALDSDEYALRTRERAERSASLRETHVNAFHPDLAAWALPPGTRSEDGVVVVGRDGWLFVVGGRNDLLRQYEGAYELPPEWLDRWRRLIDHRVESARRLGVELAMAMLPDKLATYERHFPEPIERVGPSPVERLIGAADGALIDPRAELAEAADRGLEVFLRTDQHFSFAGSHLIAARVLEALGAPAAPEPAEVPLLTYMVPGDLGIRFDPALVGPYGVPDTLGEARVVADNRAEIEATGGHLGTRRVYVNESAPDQRVLVAFGGSTSIAGPRYIGLCWFYAQVFREVHFVWVPFGWDSEYLQRVGAEAVVLTGGDRLVVRVPREEIDTTALAKETLESGRPVSVERILSPS